MDTPPATPHEGLEGLAELALGVLDGRERVDLLGHVASCRTCTIELEQLTAAALSLLTILPGVDPPVDFEPRLLDRMSRSSLGAIRKGQCRERILGRGTRHPRCPH